ncbi:MAG: hypothetical protein P0119_18830 [Nitrospira sp.]|nr:hypothetical protein [Nitrospira sp.]
MLGFQGKNPLHDELISLGDGLRAAPPDQLALIHPKIKIRLLAYAAAPAVANSPTVLTSPIPRWGSSVARAWWKPRLDAAGLGG